jgi:sugar/nucleoside kinase (ribokinase family)
VTDRVVVAGNLSLDDTVTPTGSFPDAPGGDALYTSIAVAQWGATAEILTVVGDDYPKGYLGRMVAAGIEAARIRETVGPTVHYRVTYAEDGSRTFDWLGPEERLRLTSPTAADYAMLPGADWLHLAAMPIEAQEIGAAAARAAGVPMSLDPHEEYVIGFEHRLRSLVKGAVFLPSELEARLIFPDIDVADPVGFGLTAAERLDAWHPSMVAVKLGDRGSVVRSEGRSIHVPALPTSVVDPTGAGDAYGGGFVVGWLVTHDAVVAAACGAVAAAETIGTFGAFGDGPNPTPEARLGRVEQVIASIASTGAAATGLGAAMERLRRHAIDDRVATHR